MKLDPAAFVADPELIDELERSAEPISCEKDRVLFRQGESPIGVYVVKEGGVTLTMNSVAGAELMSIKALGGSLLGLPGLIGNQSYTLTAIAHADARVSFVNRSRFTELMSRNPLLSLKVLEVLASEVRTAREALLGK